MDYDDDDLLLALRLVKLLKTQPDFKSDMSTIPSRPHPNGLTVNQLLEQYRGDHLTDLKSGQERYRQLRRIFADNPALGELSSPMLNRLLSNWSGATRNRYRAAVSHFLRWCRQHGHCDLRPELAGGREKPRDAVLSVGQVQSLYRSVQTLSPRWRPFCALLVLTGQRRGEVSRFGGSGDVWTITATKNGTDHVVHLSTHARYWARRWEAPPTDYGALKARWFAAAGVSLHYRFHDIRRSFATHLVEDGADPQVVDRILNHCGGAKGIARVYNRAQMLDARRDCMTRWEALLTQEL